MRYLKTMLKVVLYQFGLNWYIKIDKIDADCPKNIIQVLSCALGWVSHCRRLVRPDSIPGAHTKC